MKEKIPDGTRPKKRHIFISGLIILLPTLITIFLLKLAIGFLNNNIAHPLGLLIVSIINMTGIAIDKNSVWPSVIGFPIAILLIYMVGYFTATYVGKRMFKGIESWITNNFPIVKDVYPYAKQFIDTFISSDKKTEFKSVVAVQFPRPGVYIVAFVTADGLKELRRHIGKKIITVFVPTSPAPFTGFTLYMPEDEVIPMELSVDEALRIIMSGGVILPPHQKTTEDKKEEV